MWENSNCYGYNEQNCNKKCCCEEQEQKQMVCCKKIREDIYCYYPNAWQPEEGKNEKDCKQGNNERPNCNCNLKENCFKEYEQENCKYDREEEFSQCNCSKNKPYCEQEKQYFKPKKRCCFCDLFNCICGRR